MVGVGVQVFRSFFLGLGLQAALQIGHSNETIVIQNGARGRGSPAREVGVRWRGRMVRGRDKTAGYFQVKCKIMRGGWDMGDDCRRKERERCF